MRKNAIDEFSKRAIHRASVDLYKFNDAIMLVELCKEHKVPILGIDAFMIYGDKIQPNLEHSIDLSYENDYYHLALQFLNNRKNTDFVYEVTLG